MKKVGQRTLTVLLSLSMIAGFAVPAFADESGSGSGSDGNASVTATDDEIQTLANGDTDVRDAIWTELYGVLTTDGTLTIAYGTNTEEPEVGDTYNGSQVKEVYSDVGTDIHTSTDVPWLEDKDNILYVVFDESLEDEPDEYLIHSMDFWFYDCMDIRSIDATYLNASGLESMENTFYGCYWLTDIDTFSYLDVSNVSSMTSTFLYCTKLTNIDSLSDWDTGNVETMDSMFQGCTSLEDVSGLSGWNTSHVSSMKRMFSSCSELTSVDISNWDTSNVTNMSNMFYGCTNLTTIYSDDNVFVTDAVTDSSSMFGNCANLVGGNNTAYDSDKTDASMAHIDTASNPGYFTEASHEYEFDSFNVTPTWNEWAKDWTEESNNNLPTVTATFKCMNCDNIEEVNVDITIDETESYDPTCEKTGQIVATGTAEFEDITEPYSSGVITIAALGHEYEFDTFDVNPSWDEWAKNWTEASNSNLPTVKAIFECIKGDDSEEVTVDIKIDESESKNPTCTESGTIVVTGTAEYDGITEPYSETITIDATGEHNYEFSNFYVDGTPTWDEWAENWSESSKDKENLPKVKAEFVCSVCRDVKDVDADIYVDESSVDPTCMTSGTMIIKGNAECDGAEKDYSNEIEIDAFGHSYDMVIATWNENTPTDLTDDTFEIQLICNRCKDEHDFTQDDADYVTATTTDKIDCTENSKITFDITVTYDGQTYIDQEVYTVTAEGHKFSEDDAVWDWDVKTDPYNPTCTVSTECTVCGEEITDQECFIAAYETAVDPTCETDGHLYWLATAYLNTGITNGTQTMTDAMDVTLYATGHNYVVDEDLTTWTGIDDGNSAVTCTIVLKCTHEGCDSKPEITNCTISEDKTPTTCTTNGQIVYTAEGAYDGGTYTSERTKILAATGHDLDYEHPVDIDYISKASEGLAVVTIKCNNCGETIQLDYEVEYEVQYTYNATTQEYEVSIVTCSVKIYDPETNITYTFWSEEEAEELIELHNWVKDALGYAEPSCTVDGYQVWYCTNCGATMTEVEKAYGHDWNMDMYSSANQNGVTHMWSTNYQVCIFTFTCNRCDGHESVSAEVTSKAENGNTIYTASCTFNGKTFSTSVTVNALGQTIEGDLGTGTVGSNSGTGTGTGSTYYGSLGDTTVGDVNSTAKAQTDDSTNANAGTNETTNESTGTGTTNTQAAEATGAATETKTTVQKTGGVKTGDTNIFALMLGFMLSMACACIAVVTQRGKNA